MKLYKKPDERLPVLFETQDVPPLERLIYQHFGSDCGTIWYAAEYDPKTQMFYGYAIVNCDYLRGGWGYFSLDFMKSYKDVFGEPLRASSDRSGYPKRAIEIEDIALGYRLRGELPVAFPGDTEGDKERFETRFRLAKQEIDCRSRQSERS